MYGAIIGDIIGSAYEGKGKKEYNFPLITGQSTITDDSILTMAVADWLLTGDKLVKKLKSYTRKYPEGGYGAMYMKWSMMDSEAPYGSFGNGSAMRVSPISWFYDDLEDIEIVAANSSKVTHDHPEGIKGAVSVAAAIYLARTGKSKEEIKIYIESNFGYDLSRKISDIRPRYKMDETAAGSVPESLIAFMEGDSFEATIRNAVSLGGDTDTMACIAGSVAEAFYSGVGSRFERMMFDHLDVSAAQLATTFHEKYVLPKYMKKT